MAWEITRTVRVRLDVPDGRKSDLHATNDLFQHCANRTSEWAWRYPDEDCVTSKRAAEDAVYDALREETNGLHANLVQKAIKHAIDDIDNAVNRLGVKPRGTRLVHLVEPAYTSQQCSKCGCTLEENRDGQHFACLDCSYTANADYNAAKNVARRLARTLQRGQTSPAGGAFCQYALKSGIMTVNATDVASDTPVSAERESTDKPTASAVGS